jgi:hypothetical protein
MIVDCITTLFIIDPAVEGGFGEQTIVERNPEIEYPEVVSLEYRFDDWNGDEIVNSFPCHLISARLYESLSRAGVSGLAIKDVLISKSEKFDQLSLEVCLPEFYWLAPIGRISSIPRHISYAKDFAKTNIWSGHDVCLGPRAELIFSPMAMKSIDISLIPTGRIRSFSFFQKASER